MNQSGPVSRVEVPIGSNMFPQAVGGTRIWLTSARRYGSWQSVISSRFRPITPTTSSCNRRLKSSTAAEEEDDRPIRFSGSAASRMKPAYLNERNDNPTSRTVSWFFSFLALGLWFFVLREESDWDENISRSLYDRVDNLEKTNLITAINYYARNNMDATPLIKRLKEIEAEEQAALAEGQRLEAKLEAEANQQSQ